jgi:proteasome lid subunit RPN8/RPN11
MWKIRRNVLLDILEASKNLYPREFASLLGGSRKEKIVTEYVVPPVLSGKSFAAIDLLAVPVDESIIGSVHSHPLGRGAASAADRRLFRRYSVNIIAYYPFGEKNFAAYNAGGEPVEVLVEGQAQG